MTYTLEIINDLRQQVTDSYLTEERERQGDKNMSAAVLNQNVIELRLQTLIMAGVGDPANTERKTSPEMAKLAAKYMSFANEIATGQVMVVGFEDAVSIRALAASGLSQA